MYLLDIIHILFTIYYWIILYYLYICYYIYYNTVIYNPKHKVKYLQNNTIFEVGRGNWGSSNPSPVSKQDHLE